MYVHHHRHRIGSVWMSYIGWSWYSVWWNTQKTAVFCFCFCSSIAFTHMFLCALLFVLLLLATSFVLDRMITMERCVMVLWCWELSHTWNRIICIEHRPQNVLSLRWCSAAISLCGCGRACNVLQSSVYVLMKCMRYKVSIAHRCATKSSNVFRNF